MPMSLLTTSTFLSPTGIYVVYLDNTGLLTHLMGCRRFRPAPNLQDKGGDLCKLWLAAVLEEYGFDFKKHLLCSNTDGGPDVRRCGSKLLERSRELEDKLGKLVVSLCICLPSPLPLLLSSDHPPFTFTPHPPYAYRTGSGALATCLM